MGWVKVAWVGGSGLEWVGVGRSDLEWVGVVWSGLEHIGVDWSSLEWPGVGWSGLKWVGAQFNKALPYQFCHLFWKSVYFNAAGKVELDNELLKLWGMKKATMSLFYLVTLTGTSFTWDVFSGSSFSSSFNVWSKDVYSK